MPDTMGMLGGFMYGLCAIFALLPPDEGAPRQGCQKYGLWGGLGVGLVLTIVCISLFFAREPAEHWYGDANDPNDPWVKGLELFPEGDD